ncbi:2-dehydropantoate 2-reductase N-terminal domain-containing protein, partial [Staphylococcus pseudintermedius]|uniref:2-dehydropantoate 2-reductase N-terminal domain-containing protein n=1 Tax=Staphylococcus pseudintermedius TaxID=283734 RepID=UPI000E376DA3
GKAVPSVTTTFDVEFIAVKTHQIATILPQLKTIKRAQSQVILAQKGSGLLPKLEGYDVYQAVVYISGEKQADKVRNDKEYRIQLKKDAFTEQVKAVISMT